MPDLDEKDFIQEGYRQNPYPFWIWFVLLTLFAALVWGGKSWYNQYLGGLVSADPFLQVNNRDFSLFLWQNPEYMRVHAPSKTGYLPAFQYMDHVTVEPELADKNVVAPPEIIFLYHIWNRLLGGIYFNRPIPVSEFKEFLSEDEQWKPEFWTSAPTDYVKMVLILDDKRKDEDLSALPMTTLPKVVRQAFQGWKNYYKEGEDINALKPTYETIRTFLQNYPQYERSYWRNVVMATQPNYLKSLYPIEEKDVIPSKELTPFLKNALFNSVKEGGTTKPQNQ